MRDIGPTTAVLSYDVPFPIRDSWYLRSNEMVIENGAFRGTAHGGGLQVHGQFGGANQDGVVGYVHGSEPETGFLHETAFYGER